MPNNLIYETKNSNSPNSTEGYHMYYPNNCSKKLLHNKLYPLFFALSNRYFCSIPSQHQFPHHNPSCDYFFSLAKIEFYTHSKIIRCIVR